MQKILIAVLCLVLTVTSVLADTKKRPKYGCFEVTASSLNIRKRPYSSSVIVANVAKGDILIKRKRWCTLRGYWCAVATEAGVKGYADKSYIDVAPCPARLSE